MKRFIPLLFLLATSPAFSQSLINPTNSVFNVYAEAEYGFAGVLYHTLQNGDSGTNFNYITQGGQDILFPIGRFQVGVQYKRHIVNLLYQPLQIDTSVKFKDPVTIDTTTFAAGSAMDITYSFPFWRITYLYDFNPKDNITIAAGASLQIRNASIKFADKSGTNLTVTQNIGPVPAVSFLYEQKFKNNFTLTYEITGIYASSAFLNGASYSFEGSLLDTSLQAGIELKNNIRCFIGARFLGGTADGRSENTGGTWTESSSAYTNNKLATFSVTTGIKVY